MKNAQSVAERSAEDKLYAEIWEEKIRREPDLEADGALRTNAALQAIERGNRLLDVGCGEGSLALHLKTRFNEVHGIDISAEAVRLAQQRGVRASRVNLNVESIPYPDAHFDAVVALDVIEHVFDPVAFVKEIHRVLAAKGTVVISTPNIRKIQRIVSLVMGHFPRTSYDPVGFDGGHLHYFTSFDLRNLLMTNGFEVTLVEGICGDRRTWKYRLAVGMLGTKFEQEFLSSGILMKGKKN